MQFLMLPIALQKIKNGNRRAGASERYLHGPMTAESGQPMIGREPALMGGSGEPAGPDAMSMELELGPAAAAEARAALALFEGRADADSLDDVRLLVSELVTNSVRHSGSPAGSKVGLAVSASGSTLRVEVTDAGRGFQPTPRSAPHTEAGGWGLHLVDRLAHRWGVHHGARAVVWFEIDAAPSR